MLAVLVSFPLFLRSRTRHRSWKEAADAARGQFGKRVNGLRTQRHRI